MTAATMGLAFPIFFAAMWLMVGSLLGFLSGWYRLASRYPDRPEEPIVRLRGQSGMLGWVGMNGILTLSGCPTGLRIQIWRIFGPFCRPFFVPWTEIRIQRRNLFFLRSARLRFGDRDIGYLEVDASVAGRLAPAAGARWPEANPPKPETRNEAALTIFKQWVGITALASSFFIIVPRLVAPPGAYPPLTVAILFPALAFGLVSVVRYFIRIAR